MDEDKIKQESENSDIESNNSDSSEIKEDSSNEVTADNNNDTGEGFSGSLSKILNQKVEKDQTPILAKYKTADRRIKEEKKKKETIKSNYKAKEIIIRKRSRYSRLYYY